MRRMFAALPALFFAVATVGALRAQTRSITIPAWIEESHCQGRPKFQATLNGKSVPITSQLGPQSDQIIMVVLDLTSDLSFIEAAKQAMRAEISKLPHNTWVGLLRDQDGLQVLADPGANREPLLTALQAVTNSGAPNLLDTLEPALSLADALLRKSAVRVSVLYITDGSIYSYREDYTNPVINQSDPHDLSRRFPEALIQEKVSKLVNEIDALQAPLFVVHLNYRSDRLNRVYQNGLETLAEATGGETQVCHSLAEIPEAISTIFARISSAWRLTLAVPSSMHSSIQIRLSAPCEGGDVRLSWRTRLRPGAG
jgi:hypothetical protein